jgi:hypothetical protein
MLRPVGHVASTLDFVLGAMPAGFSNAQFAFALVASVEITISLEEEKTATAKAGEDEFLHSHPSQKREGWGTR